MGEELELDFIHKALLDGFDRESFRRLLRFRLDKDLDHITQGDNLSTVVFDVVTVAKQQGWLEELITQAKQENPGNYFVSILGDESNMQYSGKSQDDISEIRIVLFGSSRGSTPGFIESTNQKLSDIDSRIQRIEIVVNERFTVSSALFDSLLFRAVLAVLGLAALGSLGATIWQVVSG